MAAKHSSLSKNIAEAFRENLEQGDFKLSSEQEANINKLSKNLSDSIIKFLQDQTFQITEMKAITELETMQTSGPYKADILPQVKVVAGQKVSTAVNGGAAVGAGAVVGASGQGKTDTKGFLEKTRDGILIPKVNFRKTKGQGGALKTKGYAYIGRNPVGSSSPSNTKVKLTNIKSGTK